MRNLFLGLFFTLTAIASIQAQSRRNDIPVKQLPDEVKEVLIEYVNILRNAEDLDDCAEKVIVVMGGGLVNEDGESLRSSVKPFSLKKDFNNIKFYADPIKITRVNLGKTNGTGYGASAIKGKKYKIWIGKKKGVNGMPAPITIVVPEDHEFVKKPKVVGIGSL
jgi:hypothetical protein